MCPLGRCDLSRWIDSENVNLDTGFFPEPIHDLNSFRWFLQTSVHQFYLKVLPDAFSIIDKLIFREKVLKTVHKAAEVVFSGATFFSFLVLRTEKIFSLLFRTQANQIWYLWASVCENPWFCAFRSYTNRSTLPYSITISLPILLKNTSFRLFRFFTTTLLNCMNQHWFLLPSFPTMKRRSKPWINFSQPQPNKSRRLFSTNGFFPRPRGLSLHARGAR